MKAKVAAAEAARIRAQLAAARSDEQARLALARNRQDEVLAHARQATNALARLLADTRQLNADALALKSSDAGRRVARQPDLVAAARRLYDTDLPALAAAPDLTQRLEAVRRVERQLADALGTTHLPEPELAVLSQNAAVWADQEARRVARLRDLLAVLIREGEVKLPPAATPAADLSLDQALRQLAEAESAQRQQVFVERTGAAQTAATQTLAEAEARKIRAAAQIEADRLLAEAQAEARRVEAETKARIAAAERESQLKRDKLAAEVKEMEAAQQRNRELATAEQVHAVTTNRLKIEAIRDDARMLELKRKASDPKLQARLAPFLAPGLWQINSYSLEKAPFSFTALQACGALTPSGQGLQKLLDLATSGHDRVRPRWDNSVRVNWKGRPERQGQIVEAQQLLTELGPAFVELGLLRE